MLKHRIISGTTMTLFFTAAVIFGAWLDGSLTASSTDDQPIQATVLCILICLLLIPAQLEFAKLTAAKNLRLFTPLAIIASVLFATSWYWPQFVKISHATYLLFLSAFSLFALLFYQYLRCGTSGVLANCGVNYFSIIYLGLLSSFVLAIRINFGLWPLLMFVFVVKSADIGAYTIGTMFAKHQFAPNISPAKSWEGMAGAVALAVIVAVGFAVISDIITWPEAAAFGLIFAFIGQFGDLVESMIKRDTQKKDASNTIPGFGGILDVVDSPLVAAPFAYLFFTTAINP